MTDEEILRRLAEIEGYRIKRVLNDGWNDGALFCFGTDKDGDEYSITFNPLVSDAQCLALVKKHHLTLEWSSDLDIWFATARLKTGGLLQCEHPNLNTAACLAIRAAHNI